MYISPTGSVKLKHYLYRPGQGSRRLRIPEFLYSWHMKVVSPTHRPRARNRTVSNGDVKKKGKAVPLQAWSGPEGSRKVTFPDFMTTAQDGGTVVSLMHRSRLPPGDTPGTHFC